MKYDLHSHSYYSDGSLSPTDLLTLADERGIDYLALTDHDTIAGLHEASNAARELEINLISGIEFSCSWENQLLHVVGLNIDPRNPELLASIESNRMRRLNRAESMYEDFEQHDIFLRDGVASQMIGNSVPTRPHFAQALIDQGYAKDKKQAFKRYLVRGKPGYIPMSWASLEEVGSAINSAGGIAVLAHPMRYKFTRTKLIRLISEMIPAGIRGIEVSTGTTDKQQAAMLGELAKQFKLVSSMGSDFHSPGQPWASLGCAPDLSKELTPVWEMF